MNVQSGSHAYWQDVKGVVIDAFGMREQGKDLLDEMKGVGSQRGQLIGIKKKEAPTTTAGDDKTIEAAKKTFRDCKDVRTFHEIASSNVDSLKEAAQLLKTRAKEIAESEDLVPGENFYTANIIAVAKQRFADQKPNQEQLEKELVKMGHKLEAYAERLEYVYNVMENDLQTDVLLEGRHAKKEDWANDVQQLVEEMPTDRRHFSSMRNFFSSLTGKESELKLYNQSGQEIPLARYDGKKLFAQYLHDEVLPKMMVNLGMVEGGREEPKLNREAQEILSRLETLDATSEEKISLQEKVGELSERFGKHDATVENVQIDHFRRFLDGLPDTPDGQKLKFVLSALGTELIEATEADVKRLVGSATSGQGAPLMDIPASRTEIHLSKEGSPTVALATVHQPTEFAKDTTVTVLTKLEMDSEPGIDITLSGWALDRDFQQLRHTIELAGFPCHIDDVETPRDAVEEVTSLSDLSSSLSSVPMEEASTQYLQPLEGKDHFYIGIVTPNRLLESAAKQVVGMLGIKPEEFMLPAQSHTTFVPPNSKITVKTDVASLVPIPSFEVEFDEVTISRGRNVNLRGTSPQYNEVSRQIADKLGLPSNDRPVHSKIGMIPQELVTAMFQDPEKYGFQLREDGRLYRKLDRPVKEQVGTKPQEEGLPVHQQLLSKQLEAKETHPMQPSEAERIRKNFHERVQKVEAEKKKILEQGSDYKFKEQSVPFDARQLRLATEGDSRVGRVPLIFSTKPNGIEMWQQFKQEVGEVFERHGIDDARVQILGSGIHGFSRNPSKDMKPWRPESDADLAIFSEKLAEKCLEMGVATNKKIIMYDKFTVFKNEVPGEGVGFFDTEVGKDISLLMAKWSIKIYGDECPPDHVDFKMNLGLLPFREAVDVVTPKKPRGTI